MTDPLITASIIIGGALLLATYAVVSAIDSAANKIEDALDRGTQSEQGSPSQIASSIEGLDHELAAIGRHTRGEAEPPTLAGYSRTSLARARKNLMSEKTSDEWVELGLRGR